MSDVEDDEEAKAYLQEVLRRGPTPEEQAQIEQYLLEHQPPEFLAAMRQDPNVVGEVMRIQGARIDPDRLSDEDLKALRASLKRDYYAEITAGLTSYVCFVGYSRSGGSIVAALLDAHRQLLVAHELDVFEMTEAGERLPKLRFADREELLMSSMQASMRFADRRRGQRVAEDGTRYYSSYQVEGAWQGKCEDARAAGTKNAVESAIIAEHHGADPFHALQEQAGLPLRFVHVVRNPYDNIATMARVHGDAAVKRYRRRIVGVRTIKEAGFPVLDVHLDDVIADPRRELTRICEFYGVVAGPEYLDPCAALVADQPSRTGSLVEWTDHQRTMIQRTIDENEWLSRYAGSEVGA